MDKGLFLRNIRKIYITLPFPLALQTHLDHLLPGDLAVLVDVEELEAPENLLVVRALGDDGEKLHKVSERDAPGPLLVHGAEHDLGVLGGVPHGEYFLVHLLEGLLVDDPVGTLGLEGAVQELDLLLAELGLLHQLGQVVWPVSETSIIFQNLLIFGI